ncbi:MAG: DUF1778 domain-containing protein [Verrucomicrobiota bacterium]|jgi:uncharacterized protein (DUF1778 family)
MSFDKSRSSEWLRHKPKPAFANCVIVFEPVRWWQIGTVLEIMPTIDDERIRITARVPAEMRDALEQAAQLQGSTLNQFVVQSAYQEAQRILERETVLRLSQRDAQKVFSMLEHPPKANKQLKEAVKAYHELVRV